MNVPDPITRRAHGRRSRAAFSLLELVAVMTILSIISAAALPIVRSSARVQTHAVRASLVASLSMAQANALTTGTPSALRLDLDSQTAILIRMRRPGPGVEALADPLGRPEVERALGGADRAIVTGVQGSDLSASEPTIWFGYLGVPERRAATGALVGPATDQTVILLDGGEPIRVHPATGMIE